MELFLIKTQDCSLQARDLVNPVTDVLMRMFWNCCTKSFLRLSRKTHIRSCLISTPVVWQPSTGFKTPLHYRYFCASFQKERMFQTMFQNSKKNPLQNYLFYLTLQARSLEFSTSTKAYSEKHSFEYSEIVGNLSGKGYKEVILSK